MACLQEPFFNLINKITVVPFKCVVIIWTYINGQVLSAAVWCACFFYFSFCPSLGFLFGFLKSRDVTPPLGLVFVYIRRPLQSTIYIDKKNKKIWAPTFSFYYGPCAEALVALYQGRAWRMVLFKLSNNKVKHQSLEPHKRVTRKFKK